MAHTCKGVILVGIKGVLSFYESPFEFVLWREFSCNMMYSSLQNLNNCSRNRQKIKYSRESFFSNKILLGTFHFLF